MIQVKESDLQNSLRDGVQIYDLCSQGQRCGVIEEFAKNLYKELTHTTQVII